MMKKYTCRTCGNVFEKEASRGRPPVFCSTCREKNNPNASTKPASIKNDDVNSIIDEIIGEATPEVVVPKKVEFLGKYRVLVDNLGTAYNGNLEKDAKVVYDRYVKKSSEGFGQVGFEKVTLLCEGEIVEEFLPMKD